MRRTKSPNLTSEHILQVALELMKRDGLEDLQIRTLAEALDVTPRALYRYYPTKEDLMRAAFVHVLAGLPLPESGPWQERLRQVAQDYRRLAQEHKHMTAYLLAPHEPNYAESRMLEFLLKVAQDAGVPRHLLFVTALNIFGNLNTGLRHGRDAEAAELGEAGKEAGYAAFRAFLQGREAEYPVFMSLLEDRQLDVDSHFENQLDLIVGGLERLAAKS